MVVYSYWYATAAACAVDVLAVSLGAPSFCQAFPEKRAAFGPFGRSKGHTLKD